MKLYKKIYNLNNIQKLKFYKINLIKLKIGLTQYNSFLIIRILKMNLQHQHKSKKKNLITNQKQSKTNLKIIMKIFQKKNKL